MFNVEFLARRAGLRIVTSTDSFSDRLRNHWGAIEDNFVVAEAMCVLAGVLVDVDRREAWDGVQQTRNEWLCGVGTTLVDIGLHMEKTIIQHRQFHDLFAAARLEIAKARPSEPLTVKVGDFTDSNYHSAAFAALSEPIMDLLSDTDFIKETLASEHENAIANRIGRNFRVITDWVDHWSEAISRIDDSIRKNEDLRLELERERIQAVMLQHYFPLAAKTPPDPSEGPVVESFGEIKKRSSPMTLPAAGRAMFPEEGYPHDKKGSNNAGARIRGLIDKKKIAYMKIGHLYVFEAALVGQG